MPYLELQPFEDQTAYRVTAARPRDGINSNFIVPKSLEGGEVLGSHVKQLRETVAIAAPVMTAKIADSSEEGWTKAAPVFTAPFVGPYQRLRDAAMDRSRELDTRDANLLANRPVIPLNATEGEKLRATFAHEVRTAATVQMLTPLKPSEVIAAVSGSKELGSVVLSTPSLRAKLPGDLAERIERDTMELAFVEQNANAVKLKPTYDQPLRQGNDMDAAKSIARQAMASIEAARDELATVEMVLRSTVDFVAIVGNVSRADAFAALNA